MANLVSERTIDPSVWAARLRDFLHDCAASAPEEEADRVREACLLFLGTVEDRSSVVDSSAVEAMLACGAPESAVLRLMGEGSSFMVSRGEAGACLATVVRDDGSEEMICEGSTPALALLASHVSSLLAAFDPDGDISPELPSPISQRLH